MELNHKATLVTILDEEFETGVVLSENYGQDRFPIFGRISCRFLVEEKVLIVRKTFFARGNMERDSLGIKESSQNYTWKRFVDIITPTLPEMVVLDERKSHADAVRRSVILTDEFKGTLKVLATATVDAYHRR